jgi:phage protein D
MKPDFAVHIDGNKLQGEEAAAILGIRVFQTRAGASAFEIIVSDPQLKWQAKPTFTDCKEVKIELGVPGKLKKIFDGEVTAWRTELERDGPTVLVLRGMDRSHRLMRARKTKTYANASPLDCAQQIAGQHGLTAKTRAGSPAPVQMFRFQANQTDFDFLHSIAQLEGYMFWVEGSELHFERPEISSKDDAEFSFGENIKAFLPVANFRKPPVSVEVGAWDVSGKSELTGKARTGDELWSVPGGEPGAKLAKFTSTRPELSLVESQVGTQEHADTVARAALTRRSMEFITAEVEVQGTPAVKPGALVNLKRVGPYSGHYLVTEANHFYDAAGYNCIFYVARDKWGDSSVSAEQQKAAKQQQKQARAASAAAAQPKPRKARPAVVSDGIHRRLVDEDSGDPLAGVEYEITLHGGEKRTGTTDQDGFLEEDDVPTGNFIVRVTIVEPDVFQPHPLSLRFEDGEDRRAADAREPSSLVAFDAAAVHLGAVLVHPSHAFQGDTVKLSADAADAEDGATLVFRIFRVDGQEAVAEVRAEVAAGRAEACWQVPPAPVAGKQDGYEYADFDLEADCGGAVRRAGQVPALRAFAAPVTDGIQRRLVDEESGEPLPFTDYELRLDDGEVRRGRTDGDGFLLEEDVPPGTFTVEAVGTRTGLVLPDEVTLRLEDEELPPASAWEPSSLSVASTFPVLLSVAASPSRLFAGQKVRIAAHLLATDGEEVVFRVFSAGSAQPLAWLPAKAQGGVAACDWTVGVEQAAGVEDGFAYADFDIEAECRGAVVRAPELPAFRAYREDES